MAVFSLKTGNSHMMIDRTNAKGGRKNSKLFWFCDVVPYRVPLYLNDTRYNLKEPVACPKIVLKVKCDLIPDSNSQLEGL